MQDVILLLAIFNGTKLDTISLSARVSRDMLVEINNLVRDASLQRTTSLVRDLEREYNESVFPLMRSLEGYRKRMGDRYATAMIIPPVLVSGEERDEIFGHMRVGAQLHFYFVMVSTPLFPIRPGAEILV